MFFIVSFCVLFVDVFGFSISTLILDYRVAMLLDCIVTLVLIFLLCSGV